MEYDLPSFDAVGGSTFEAAKDPGGVRRALAAVGDPGDAPVMEAPRENVARLPFGLADEADYATAHEAQVRELTGADEEALARVAADPLRYYDTLLSLGTVSVGGRTADRELLRSLTMADRDTLLLAIRRATYGNLVEIERVPCPHCGQASDIQIPIDEITMTSDEDGRVFEVRLRAGTATVRQPTGHDQMAFAGRDLSPAEQNTLLLSRVVTKIADGRGERAGSLALAKSLGMADRRALLKALGEHSYGPKYAEISMTHEACGGEVPIPLTPGDLFRG